MVNECKTAIGCCNFNICNVNIRKSLLASTLASQKNFFNVCDEQSRIRYLLKVSIRDTNKVLQNNIFVCFRQFSCTFEEVQSFDFF